MISASPIDTAIESPAFTWLPNLAIVEYLSISYIILQVEHEYHNFAKRKLISQHWIWGEFTTGLDALPLLGSPSRSLTTRQVVGGGSDGSLW